MARRLRRGDVTVLARPADAPTVQFANAVGRLTATSVTRLTETAGATHIDYDVDTALTGKLGSLGQPVLRAKAKEMERQFAPRLAEAFAAPAPGTP